MATVGPFPGPDPWLEANWSGFHHLFLSHIQNLVNRQVRPLGLVARIDEHVFVEAPSDGGRAIRPDVFVVRPAAAPRGGGAKAANTAVADEPLHFRLADEPETTGYIEIVAAADQARVITAVEVLSPTNKLDPRARRAYLRKRTEYRAGAVSTVEIDLLRDGESLGEVPPQAIPASHRTPYAVWVQRGWLPVGSDVEYYAVPLRRRLPRIAVPLRETDADVTLDLQAAFAAAYEQGSYDVTDYDRPLDPPLPPDDAAWARERIEAWRRSPGGDGGPAVA